MLTRSLLAAIYLFIPVTAVLADGQVTGESVVLMGTEPTNLLGKKIDPVSFVVRSTHLPDQSKTIVYERGRDFTIDAAAGTISRTKDSRIPDFKNNILYGKKNFNHSQFPGYGNLAFTIYVDYTAADVPDIRPKEVEATSQLPRTVKKLKANAPLKIIAFGDSITAGGEASCVDLQFTPRWIRETLQKRYPNARIVFENGATGGDRTVEGLARLADKVLSRQPDLVLLAFGMNDHNLSGTPLPQFRDNLRSMVKQIRDATGAEVILLSAFPPNPDWVFGSHQMEKYAAATKKVADEVNAPYADVFGVWEKVLKRKDLPSLLGNNINHPNDFGHWLYVVALNSLHF